MNQQDNSALLERIAQITAHRVCCGYEHDPANGKLHGYCVVCGVPWPCAYAAEHPDTARLDWLEANPESGEPFIVYHPPSDLISWMIKRHFQEYNTLREAIDAARAAHEDLSKERGPRSAADEDEFSVVVMDSAGNDSQPAQLMTASQIAGLSGHEHSYVLEILGKLEPTGRAWLGGGAYPMCVVSRPTAGIEG